VSGASGAVGLGELGEKTRLSLETKLADGQHYECRQHARVRLQQTRLVSSHTVLSVCLALLLCPVFVYLHVTCYIDGRYCKHAATAYTTLA